MKCGRAAGRVAEVLAARAPSLTALIARIDDPDLFVLGFGGGWEGSIPALFAFDRRGDCVLVERICTD